MADFKKVNKLESILDKEVRTNDNGVYFVDFDTIGSSKAIYTPKMEKIKELGFEVTAIRAGYNRILRVWFDYEGEGLNG